NELHQLGMFEAGISEPGEMSSLEKMIRPTIGVFTNIGEAHSEGFSNIREKVDEKMKLFTGVETLVYCKDYPSIDEAVEARKKLSAQHNAGNTNFFSWSAERDATLRVLTVGKQGDNTRITALYKQEEVEICIPFTDEASILNCITCWCVLLYLGVDMANAGERFAALSPVSMRLELKKGMNNCSIINDSYSADLSSLKIALDFLTQQHQHSKRTVILSDFLQSGRPEKELYPEIAGLLKQRSVNRLIGIGIQISTFGSAFTDLPGLESSFYPDMPAFLRAFPSLSFSNETILLKGARIFGFERISLLLEQKVHQTVLEIDRNAILHNLAQYQNILKPSTRVMAMVKAFSYGSGSYEIASLLQFHKIDYLGVAYADEAVELRKAGITLPIMVMNPEESTFDALVNYNLEPDIYSFMLLDQFNAFLEAKGLQQFPVHIELETGMHRLGFEISQVPRLVDSLQSSSFKIQSVFSHLVASEDPAQDEFTLRQAELFSQACADISRATGYPFLRHIDNSAGISRHPGLQFDMVRLGIGLYGIDGSPDRQLDLIEVSTLVTTIAQIKQLRKGDSVGYGRKELLEEDTLIATVRIGYADGYPRRMSRGKGKMLINGQLAPVIGNICMDMTMLNITGISNVKEGDDIIVFGRGLPVKQVADWADTIPYEILTGVSQRVKRVYYE
ncbi:MAG TPA: bifunctional UDP-N-acetylmuramoyl-tripeptide:D-alanyl-D-alanine ligase/alanine racemase, partial [Chitinophagaceae bacterium]|nr:bifunctional UDP-N-acetylmuramoyl-tripeptide:D-alanyl-D-alanine ligase/alanine racemase [Chitinophagaceae bacterium]